MNTPDPLAPSNSDATSQEHVTAPEPAVATAAVDQTRSEPLARHASGCGAIPAAVVPATATPVQGPEPAGGPTVRYSNTVRLSVPIVADGETIRALEAVADPTATARLETVAQRVGLVPPSAHHTWAIGWSGPASAPDRRLVWYDPDKLRGIRAMIDTVAAAHPALSEVTVVQGAGWDDWGVYFTADNRDGADGPDEVEDGEADTPASDAMVGGGSDEETGEREVAGERLLEEPVPMAERGAGTPVDAAEPKQPALARRAGGGERVLVDPVGHHEPPFSAGENLR